MNVHAKHGLRSEDIHIEDTPCSQEAESLMGEARREEIKTQCVISITITQGAMNTSVG